ncbi:uncharacterized protein G2W53_039989 [Senna tora]|uniref:Uncharacterized protein n=1 Tax=Senna tora TaxID=362788 RepID=A0A834W441_9FABA|nr:uncharacterized protein G2W53_039989 [Senna tora]
MTQGSLPRSFKAIRVGRQAVDHVDRRTSKIIEPWVNFFSRQFPRAYAGQNEAYDTRKPPKKFQCNPTCVRPNLRRTTTWIAVGRRPSKINHPWPMTQGNLPRSVKAIQLARGQIFDGVRLGSLSVADHPKSITHGSTFFSRQNLTCICCVKMIPMTQGSLPRSFKAIRVGRPAVDHVDRRPSKINESCVNFFVGKISGAYAGSK